MEWQPISLLNVRQYGCNIFKQLRIRPFAIREIMSLPAKKKLWMEILSWHISNAYLKNGYRNFSRHAHLNYCPACNYRNSVGVAIFVIVVWLDCRPFGRKAILPRLLHRIREIATYLFDWWIIKAKIWAKERTKTTKMRATFRKII